MVETRINRFGLSSVDLVNKVIILLRLGRDRVIVRVRTSLSYLSISLLVAVFCLVFLGIGRWIEK